MAAEKLTKKQLKSASYRKKAKKGEDGDDEVAAVAADVIEPREERLKSKRAKIEPIESIAVEVEAKGEPKEKKRKNDKSRAKEDESTVEAPSSKPASIAADKKEKKELKRKLREENEKEAKESGGKKRSGDDGDKKNKKRRRDEGKDEKPNAIKKRFTEDGQVKEVEVIKKEEAKADEDKKDDKRYIVFVGNMSFKSTAVEIEKHFTSHCTEKPSVRLLTKKGDSSKLAQLPKSKQKSIAKGKAADPSAPVSKGCAFLEFKSASALQKALQFHHTQFQGRNINVELTAGGGGKGNDRKEKIRKKNQDLEVERQKIHEKYVKNSKKDKEGGETKTKEAAAAEKEVEPAKPAWGPRAASASTMKGRAVTKIPRWAASGSNAVRLSG